MKYNIILKIDNCAMGKCGIIQTELPQNMESPISNHGMSTFKTQ